ncbi:hypothetical protein [Alteribacillus persepolensis]|nr:hypothetical protein [Alteribacillus persepolensis]
MERNRAYYRHQRKKAINKKSRIIKNTQLFDDKDEMMDIRLRQPGRLHKMKVHCSCKMCKYEKHFAIPKARLKAEWRAMEKEIEDYLNDSY